MEEVVSFLVEEHPFQEEERPSLEEASFLVALAFSCQAEASYQAGEVVFAPFLAAAFPAQASVVS